MQISIVKTQLSQLASDSMEAAKLDPCNSSSILFLNLGIIVALFGWVAHWHSASHCLCVSSKSVTGGKSKCTINYK